MSRDRIIIGAVAIALLAAVVAGLFLLGERIPTPENLATTMERGLTRIQTVQGRLSLTQGTATIEQEFWAEPPLFLRTEIESGPPGMGPSGNRKTTLVLNEEEAWFYNPSLELVTVASRGGIRSTEPGESGLSLLETLPSDLLWAMRRADEIWIAGTEQMAQREALRVELTLEPEDSIFEANQVSVWLDREFYYPLAVESDQGLRLVFQFIRFNRAIDPATFVFVPPPGATVHRVGE